MSSHANKISFLAQEDGVEYMFEMKDGKVLAKKVSLPFSSTSMRIPAESSEFR